MAPRTLPGLGLSGFWLLGEDGWKDAMDANLLALSVLVQAKAISRVTALPGSPSDGDIYIVPTGAGSNPDEIAARDNGAWVYIVPVEGDRVWVTDENVYVVFNGTDWIAQTIPMSVPMSYAAGPPTASEILYALVTTETLYFAANFAGSAGYIGVNPTATFAIDVLDDGASIGTISISTGGAFTFTTSGGTAKTVAAGSRLEFIAPGTPDASAEYILATLKAYTVL